VRLELLSLTSRTRLKIQVKIAVIIVKDLNSKELWLCFVHIVCLDQDLSYGLILCELHEDFPASEASYLGSHLGLPPARLKEFSYNNPRDCKKEMQDVLDYWLTTDREKSWTKLAAAVKLCGYESLAEKIRRKSTE